MDLNRVYTWQMPTKLIVGCGCSRQAGEELKKLGGRKALIVTDSGVEGAGVLSSILEGLKDAGVSYAVFNGVMPNPTVQCTETAADIYKAEGCDCLLGVGGGSAMDTAKAAGVMVNNPGIGIRALEGVDTFANPLPTLIAIPTTCGTGSEVTFGSVITDAERHYKFPVFSIRMAPRVALIDGSLLTKLPGPIIASTGMDALCHALESYTNLNTNPISDALDLHAIRLISLWLRPAVANANPEAMSYMVLASCMAGIGFTNTRTSIVHAMSHPVSGFYGVAHGVANAVLLPYLMEFNLIGNIERFTEIARAMGENTIGLTTMEAARLSIKAVKQLNQDVGIPDSLKPYGVDETWLDPMVEDAMKSGLILINPVRVNRAQVKELYRRAME